MMQVRSLVEDIRDVRFHKVETGLETISGRTHAVKVIFPTSGLQELNQLPQILRLQVGRAAASHEHAKLAANQIDGLWPTYRNPNSPHALALVARLPMLH